MTASWLVEQSRQMVLSWEKAIQRSYPQHLENWTDPSAHLKALNKEWNLLPAAMFLDWDQYLVSSNIKVLDWGAGTGWLSILLSRRENIAEIYAVDASPHNLQVMLPALVEPMHGIRDKIKPVLGLFTPILVEDCFFDIAVASSAVHHAPDLTELLEQVYRVLKPGGCFLILNEQPLSSLRYALTTIFRCAKILGTVLVKRWQPVSKPVSETGITMDPFLGDRAFCDWQWQKAIEAAGFSFRSIQTPFYPLQGIGRDWRQPSRLTHFVATKLK